MLTVPFNPTTEQVPCKNCSLQTWYLSCFFKSVSFDSQGSIFFSGGGGDLSCMYIWSDHFWITYRLTGYAFGMILVLTSDMFFSHLLCRARKRLFMAILSIHLNGPPINNYSVKLRYQKEQLARFFFYICWEINKIKNRFLCDLFYWVSVDV